MDNEVNMQTTIYDFAKAIVNGKPPMSKNEIKAEIKKIAKRMRECPEEIFFMICPDLRQYVVFQVTCYPDTKQIIQDLTEVLENRGTIVDIDDSESNIDIWEIWIRDKYDKKVYMYQLTNYEDGVVTLGRVEN